MKPILHGIGVYDSAAVIGPARWIHYDLIVMTEGSAKFTIGKEVFPVLAGDAFLIPPKYQFQGVAGDAGCRIWVQHFDRVKSSALPSLELPSRPTIWSGALHDEWRRSIMKQISRHHNGPTQTISILLVLLIQEFLSVNKLDSGEGAVDKFVIQSTLQWIKEQSFPLPSLAEIAKVSGWSISHFRDKFREVYGRPIGYLLRELKMDESVRLLSETSLPVKAIAVRVGYSDLVAFHRAFQRSKMMTPGCCRRQNPRVV